MLSLLTIFLCGNALATDNTMFSNQDLRKLFIISGHNGIEKNVQYGGMVLFKQNLEQTTACAIKKQYPDTLIYIDQEGGDVRRYGEYILPSAKEATKMTIDNYEILTQKTAQGLSEKCIDVNLAPFVELKDENNRSYGTNYQKTKQYATVFVKSMEKFGIKTVLKHFPGEADKCTSVSDLSNIGLKIKEKSEVYQCSIINKKQFDKNLQIFLEVPSNAIMIGQGIYSDISPYPALLEPKIRYWLVEQLKYKKPLISDALWEIEATPQTIIRALKTVDFVMVGYPGSIEAALPFIQQAIKNGELTHEEIEHKLDLWNNFRKK